MEDARDPGSARPSTGAGAHVDTIPPAHHPAAFGEATQGLMRHNDPDSWIGLPGHAPHPGQLAPAHCAQALRTRDAVLRSVAHDLRSPLNGIVLAASALEGLARTRSFDPGPLLGAIRREVTRMSRMIEDLLDVGRTDDGSLDLQPEASRPADLLRDCLDEFAPVCSSAGVALAERVEPGLSAVRADRVRVQRVLSNLMDNAVRYSTRGSRIEVAAEWADATAVRFAVIDHGPGVAAEERPRLFEPFWRSRRAHGSGSGLGLSIAHDIVAAHGGSIGFEETHGGGSTFFFTLPTQEESHG